MLRVFLFLSVEKFHKKIKSIFFVKNQTCLGHLFPISDFIDLKTKTYVVVFSRFCLLSAGVESSWVTLPSLVDL